MVQEEQQFDVWCFSLLSDTLGNPLSAEEVAQELGTTADKVRKHYKRFCGIKVDGKYIFYERQVLHAIQDRREMDRSNKETEAPEILQHEEGSNSMGSGTETARQRRPRRVEDVHGLFPRSVGD